MKAVKKPMHDPVISEYLYEFPTKYILEILNIRQRDKYNLTNYMLISSRNNETL